MMRSAWKMLNSTYITTRDEKGHKHHYRLTAQQIGQQGPEDWKGEDVERMSFSTYRLSGMISDESARNLWKAVN